MYLKECLIENVGPIEFLDISLPFNEDHTPKPLILVGKNGSGKSILVSYIVDALIEFAKVAYEDIVLNQQAFSAPYFKLNGPINQRIGSKFSIGLLEFLEKDKNYSYLDKSGTLGTDEYLEKMKDRFVDIRNWLKEGNDKKCSQDTESFRKIFLLNSLCYFPSSRVERPHWLNSESVAKNLSFGLKRKLTGKLGKPVFIESSVEENKKWILDVFLDSKVDFEPVGEQFIILGDIPTKVQLKQSKRNIEIILQQILQQPSVMLTLNHRNNYQYRLCVAEGNRILIPSLDHLSSGQSILFNLFITIIRYADKGDINKSIKLHEIEGIIIIDEVDAHLDTELQYSILPHLLKLFPRIQFILTTHSPLFLLGMERKYGKEGFEVIEMPIGEKISIERFSEFQRSFDYYKDTKKFEDDLRIRILEGKKTLVLTEGKTDPEYIKAGLDALGRADILERLDVEWVGKRDESGDGNTGVEGLNKTRAVLDANPSLLKQRLLLLYDCDAKKPKEDMGLLSIRTIPKNEENTKVKKGIENLFPTRLFEKRFYPQKIKIDDYGASTVIEKLDKVEFCKWVCTEGKTADNFQGFLVVVKILEEILELDAILEAKSSA